MEYKVKQVQKDNILYVLDNVPFTLDTTGMDITKIYVPSGSESGYKGLNTDLAGIIEPLSYSPYRITKLGIEDEATVIMDRNTNAPVLDVMYSKGLCANENYMTLAEAKAVTNADLPNLFRDNTAITSFDEFKYFTGITETGSYMCAGAYNMESITLPSTCRVIKDRFCMFSTANLKAGIENKLKRVEGVENIEEVQLNAFQFCYNIKSLNFTSKLKKLSTAFYGVDTNASNTAGFKDQLESVGDLSGVEEWVQGTGQFTGRGSLKGVLNMPKLLDIPQLAPETHCDLILDWENIRPLTDSGLFLNMYGLTKVGNLNYIGPQYMFSECYNLRSVGKINAETINRYTFSECRSLEKIESINATSIAKGAFYNTKSLKNIGENNVLDTVTYIDDVAFQDSGIEYISLPNLESTNRQVFNHCLNLKQVKDLNKLTTVNSWTFANCPKLKYIYFPVANAVNEGAFRFATEGEYMTEETEDRTIEFALPFEEITWATDVEQPILDNCHRTKVICGGVELTAAQYDMLGGVKPNITAEELAELSEPNIK